MKRLVLLACFLNMSIAYAHTWGTKEVVCPLGGEKFQTTVDMSGTRFGMQLDLKPLGPIAAPWRLPVCPGNHFVVYKDTEDFTDDEIRHLESAPERESIHSACVHATSAETADATR